MNAISTLTILPKSKTEIDNYVGLVKEDILSGYINPLESAIMLKSFEEIVKALRQDDDIKAYIDSEADKYGSKNIEFHGAKICVSDRTSYDYANCNDSVWSELNDKLNQLKSEIKGRENWLKTLKNQTPDYNTGELINPPATSYSKIISITLKK